MTSLRRVDDRWGPRLLRSRQPRGKRVDRRGSEDGKGRKQRGEGTPRCFALLGDISALKRRRADAWRLGAFPAGPGFGPPPRQRRADESKSIGPDYIPNTLFACSRLSLCVCVQKRASFERVTLWYGFFCCIYGGHERHGREGGSRCSSELASPAALLHDERRPRAVQLCRMITTVAPRRRPSHDVRTRGIN